MNIWGTFLHSYYSYCKTYNHGLLYRTYYYTMSNNVIMLFIYLIICHIKYKELHKYFV